MHCLCVDEQGAGPFEEDQPPTSTYQARQEESRVVSRFVVGFEKPHKKHRFHDSIFQTTAG